MEATGRNWGRPALKVTNKVTGKVFTLTNTDILRIKEMKKTMSYDAIAAEYHISVKPIWSIMHPKYKVAKDVKSKSLPKEPHPQEQKQEEPVVEEAKATTGATIIGV
jgi:hypothetical protein